MVVKRTEAKHYAVFIAVLTDIAADVHFEIKIILLRRRSTDEEKGIGLPDSQIELAVIDTRAAAIRLAQVPRLTRFEISKEQQVSNAEQGRRSG